MPALGAALLMFSLAGGVQAQPATEAGEAQRLLALRTLAATCANCHGTDGRAISGADVPGLAGQPAAYLVEQMNAFRSGARQATVMHQLAKGYTPAQIEALAAHFAALPR